VSAIEFILNYIQIEIFNSVNYSSAYNQYIILGKNNFFHQTKNETIGIRVKKITDVSY